MKTRWPLVVVMFGILSGVCRAQSVPAPPWLLDLWPFIGTNFYTHYGYAPLAQSNVTLASTWNPYGHALWVDSAGPAFVQYNAVEADGQVELVCGLGAVLFWFSPDWSSQCEGGQGPGVSYAGRFVDVGAWTPDASGQWWSLYVAPGGNEIDFSAQSNGFSATYVSAPIDWVSNSWHLVGLTYTPTNSVLYLDGAVAATGAGVSYFPDAGTMGNGWFMGSDWTGTNQVRGLVFDFQTWSGVLGGDFFTNVYEGLSPEIANWQAGGGEGADFAPGGLLPLGSGGGCPTGGAVYITNVSSMVSNGVAMFVFTIAGGAEDAVYDVFEATNLEGGFLTNSAWTWIGQGTNCGSYAVTNQATNQAYYVLGTPLLAADGSGLTVAYERLVGASYSGDGYGTPNGWYVEEGISPQVAGVGTEDLDGDGLVNWQEYLWGSNPQGSQGFGVWVGEPGATSGIP